MNARCCHQARGPSPEGPARYWLKGVGSALPGVIAILLPKCPLCLAAWVAAGTGVALPAMAVGGVRVALWIACGLALFQLVRRRGGERI
jgi:hypothetical protein